jgi:hypothetical protein
MRRGREDDLQLFRLHGRSLADREARIKQRLDGRSPGNRPSVMVRRHGAGQAPTPTMLIASAKGSAR